MHSNAVRSCSITLGRYRISFRSYCNLVTQKLPIGYSWHRSESLHEVRLNNLWNAYEIALEQVEYRQKNGIYKNKRCEDITNEYDAKCKYEKNKREKDDIFRKMNGLSCLNTRDTAAPDGESACSHIKKQIEEYEFNIELENSIIDSLRIEIKKLQTACSSTPSKRKQIDDMQSRLTNLSAMIKAKTDDYCRIVNEIARLRAS